MRIPMRNPMRIPQMRASGGWIGHHMSVLYAVWVLDVVVSGWTRSLNVCFCWLWTCRIARVGIGALVRSIKNRLAFG
jgi:hypothetical protein